MGLGRFAWGRSQPVPPAANAAYLQDLGLGPGLAPGGPPDLDGSKGYRCRHRPSTQGYHPSSILPGRNMRATELSAAYGTTEVQTRIMDRGQPHVALAGHGDNGSNSHSHTQEYARCVERTGAHNCCVWKKRVF